MELNKAQQMAARHGTGAMLVLAGPGSGKTAVITERVRWLAEEEKVPPDKILVITFSRAAAVNMKKRFEDLTSHQYSSVNFGTFHAVFFNIIKNETQYDNSSILPESDKYRFIREKIRELNIMQDRARDLPERIVAAISAVKGGSAALSDVHVKPLSDAEFATVFHSYNRYLAGEDKLDFDDMMGKCLELFERDPGCLARWQEKYRYILVDEFQDINALQYRLVKMLAAPENNLFAVGDDDQSIYGFRGAKPDIMFAFEKDFRGCRRILLDVNYRSHGEILEKSLALVRHNKTRFKKRLSSSRGDGGACEYLRFDTFEEENGYIVKYLETLRDEGKPLKDTAVLFRMRHEVSTLYRLLCKAGIPYRMGEKPPSIFEHMIAEDMFAYLRIAAGVGSRGDILRVINRPNRYVTRESVRVAADLRISGPGRNKAADTAEKAVDLNELIKVNSSKSYVCENLKHLIKHLDFISKIDVPAAIKYIRKAVGYDAWLKDYAKEQRLSFEELSDIAAELEQSAAGCDTLAQWLEVAEDLREGLARKEPEDGVTLMTFHASKGLEFDTVFIIDLLEGSIPSKRAETPEQIEEERRALYVAMTRAKNRLVLMSSRERLGRMPAESRFVREIFGGKEGKGDGRE